MRLFVTGATGVVGTHLVPQLVAKGHSVTAIARSTEKRVRLQTTGATVVELNIFDRVAARRAFERQDAVINLATHMPPSSTRMLLPWEWRENDRVRHEGSRVLVDAALEAGVGRFLQESFAPIYEDGGDGWIDERSPVKPAPYNLTALDAEHSAERFSEAGRTGVVLRFAAFYGSDPFLREVVKLVKRGWSPIPGAANAYWSSVSHVDAASATAAALGVPGGTYNVCDDEPLTRREWVDVVAGAAGAKPPSMIPHWLSALGGRTMELLSRSQRMSNAKLKAASDWQPRYRSAREGLPVAVHGAAN